MCSVICAVLYINCRPNMGIKSLFTFIPVDVEIVALFSTPFSFRLALRATRKSVLQGVSPYPRHGLKLV